MDGLSIAGGVQTDLESWNGVVEALKCGDKLTSVAICKKTMTKETKERVVLRTVRRV